MQGQKVRFKSGGLYCAGDLYIPDDYTPGSPRPGLVIGHGFSFVKEALVEEAGYFTRAGYVVLAIDYRTFGESEGEPRGQLLPLNEVEDYRNAISYLQSREEVDPGRTGIWGDKLWWSGCDLYSSRRSTGQSSGGSGSRSEWPPLDAVASYEQPVARASR